MSQEEHPQIKAMIANLDKIKEKYGEVAYRRAADEAGRLLLRQDPETARVAREVLKDVVDFDKLDKEPPPSPSAQLNPEQLMAQALKQQMPGLQTQAQYNVVMTAFDSLRVHMNAVFMSDKPLAERSKTALLQALEGAVQVTELSQKLGHVPEAATSAASEDFKQPPKMFHEYDVQRGLLTELEQITSLVQFQQWYTANRTRIEMVVSPNFRNALFDAMRDKKGSFSVSS
jgi:CCR4-NOT transcriptional regulation complex NOT5 subunit